jgi:mono/diheme cytochrome c family protein
MKRGIAGAAVVCGALVLAACASTTDRAPETGGISGGASGDQVALGAKLYGENCASCHGASGEGGKAPPLVGKAALPLDPPATAKFRKAQFHTGADVFAFVKATMPPVGNKLTDEQYAAILAFDLKANGVDMTGKTVSTSTASSFVLR